MDLALVVVSILLAVLLTASAAWKLSHTRKVVESYRTAGVPESWLNGLAALLLAAAAGLVVGLWWPIASIAAAVGLVVYFVLAVGFHIGEGTRRTRSRRPSLPASPPQCWRCTSQHSDETAARGVNK